MRQVYKKIIMHITLTLVIASLTGCVSKSAYSNLDEQLNELQTLNAELTNHINELKTENESLKNETKELMANNEKINVELEEIKNGAANRLINMKNAFEGKDYTKVIELAVDLHKNFNGSAEDNEGLSLKTKAENAIELAKKEKEEADLKVKEEADKSAKEKARSIIRITKLKFSEPNSAGGVDLFIGFKNMSDKVIKYAYFTVKPYNAVDDPAYCTIRNKSLMRVNDTGPYKKGEGLAGNYDGYWECLWYSYDINRIELEEITIEYMDGTKITLIGDDIEYVIY